MNTRLLIGIVLVSAAQLAAPAWMIAGRERTLREGALYRFRTAPVDPYDAFRGRYVAIAVETQPVAWEGDAPPTRRRSRDVYASLATDADGYGVVRSVSAQPPATGDFVRAKAWSWNPEGHVRVTLPIHRYYLPEDEAPEAERAYREHSRSGHRDAEVRVRVRRGDLVVEELVVEDKPIREWLRAAAEPETP